MSEQNRSKDTRHVLLEELLSDGKQLSDFEYYKRLQRRLELEVNCRDTAYFQELPSLRTFETLIETLLDEINWLESIRIWEK